MNARETAVRRIAARAEGDWRLATLAVLALPEQIDDVLSAVGAAMRAARLEIGTKRRGTRVGTSLAGMKAANASTRTYGGPDAVYGVRDADIREWTLDEAMAALEKALWKVPDAQIDAALEALHPLMVKLLDKGIIRGEGAREKAQASIAARFLDEGRRKALQRLGTVARDSKAKRMKPTAPTPHSGTASRAVVIGDPGSGKCWEVYPDRYEMVDLNTALRHLHRTDTLPAHKPGWKVLRREASDEALANLKRPVVKPGRNSGKQKGRVGGPMIVRGGRP